MGLDLSSERNSGDPAQSCSRQLQPSEFLLRVKSLGMANRRQDLLRVIEQARFAEQIEQPKLEADLFHQPRRISRLQRLLYLPIELFSRLKPSRLGGAS
jgi:hypothetical protein